MSFFNHVRESSFLFCTKNDRGHVLDANDPFLEAFGLTLSDLRDKSLLEYIHPNDKLDYQAIINDKVPVKGCETRIVSSNGESAWLCWFIYWNAEERLFFCIAQQSLKDQSEPHLSRSFPSIVTDSINILISYLDSEFRYRFVNQPFLDWFCRKKEELIGYVVEDIMGQALFKHNLPYYKRALNGETVSFVNEITCPRDKMVHQVRVTYIPDSHEGKVRGFYATIEDLTVERNMQKDLITAKDKALAYSKKTNEFLSSMSHEIRTPMNGIIGILEILKSTHLDDHQQDLVNTIEGSSKVLLNLINQVLDLSKLNAQKMSLVHQEFSLRKLVEDLLYTLIQKATKKKLLVLGYIDPRIPTVLIGDHFKLSQILINLVSNAIKFTEQGYIFVSITPGEQTDSSYLLNISVKDTGVGIPSKDLDDIFEPFIQVHPYAYEGTGLGLSLTKQFVTLLEGTITVNSTPNEGSEFRLSLPFSHSETANMASPLRKALHIGIITTEDESSAVNAAVLENYLSFLGSKTFSASIEAFSIEKFLKWSQEGSRAIILDCPLTHISLFTNLITQIKRYQIPLLITQQTLTTPPSFDTSITFIQSPIKLNQIIEAFNFAPNPHFEFNKKKELHQKTRSPSFKALIIEDNPINQKVAKLMLENLGGSVSIAENGTSGLANYMEFHQNYNVVFIDCQMPDIDGYTVTKRIRSYEMEHELPPKTIIAMTANVIEGERDKCLKCGMNEYLSKPMKKEGIQAMLEQFHIL